MEALATCRTLLLACGLVGCSSEAGLGTGEARFAGPPVIPGWTVKGDLQEYAVTIDTAVKHGGSASVALRALVPYPQGSIQLSQSIPAQAFLGKGMRVSFFVRTDGVDLSQGWKAGAGYGLITLEPGTKPPCAQPGVGFSSQVRSGTSNWTKESAVGVVSCNAETISFGLGLRGPGTVWIDDVTAEVHDLASENTLAMAGFENLDFERRR